MNDQSNPRQQSPWRMFGTGMELAGAILILALIGYLLDEKFGWTPWGVLTGAMMGLAGSMYNIYKALDKANRESNPQDHDDR